MVHIRVLGRPDDVDAATELWCRVATVSEVSHPRPARAGGIMRYLTATLVPEDECHHATAEVVSRRPVPSSPHVVEYGVCVGCQARVLRVADEAARTVGGWSALYQEATTAR